MKRMIFLALAALCLSSATTLSAQTRPAKERPNPEQMAQQITNRIAQELNLTQEQAKEVYNVQLTQINQMKAHREAMRRERQQEDTSMKGILSAEQYEKWSQMQSHHRRAKADCNNCGKCGKCDKCKMRNCEKSRN